MCFLYAYNPPAFDDGVVVAVLCIGEGAVEGLPTT